MGNASSREDVKLLAEIGQGSYAVVYRAVWSQKPVAAKKLHPYLFEKPDVANRFREEWELLRSLNHENIVKYLTVVLPQTPDDTPVIITELLDQDLRNFIRNSKTNPKVSFGNAISILLDVASGLNYLHQPPRFIVHRDLASKNILLTFDGRAKIADFGFAKSFPEGEMVASANPGTIAYRAPETYGPRAWSRKAKYSEKSDVFSFGVVLLELIVGHVSLPSADLRTEDGTPIPEDCRRSQDLDEMGHEHPLRPVLLWCILNDPQQRPSAAELVDVLSNLKVESEVLRSHDDHLQGKGVSVYRVSGERHDYEFKVMMVGEVAVGKTSIVTRFVKPNRPFQERLPSTIQFGEFYERFQLKGKSVVLHVFDTSGEFNVHSVLPQLYRGAHGAVVVFDVTSLDSLQKVRQWVSLVRNRCDKDVPIILAGNKTDCEHREVDTETVEGLCEEFQLFYIEVSAKTGKNIDEIFSVLTEKLMQPKDVRDGSGSSTSLRPYNRMERESNNLGAVSMLYSAITEKEPAKPRKIGKDPESICLDDKKSTTTGGNSKSYGARKTSCC